MDTLSRLWLDSAYAAVVVVEGSRVRGQWSEPSSLPQMTVGNLAGHLMDSGILQAEEGFALTTGPAGEPITAAKMLSWVPLDEGSPVHVGVRSAAASQAVEGSQDLVERARASLRRSEALLERRALTEIVAHPWAPTMPMTLREFVCSRVLEVVVHLDDLVCSVGIEELPVDPEAIDLACRIGLDINRERFGSVAVLRSLFRSDRASLDALRTF